MPQRASHPIVATQILPLADLGVLDLFDGDLTMADGVTAFATPGHAPGHVSVRIEDGDDTLVLLADAAVHPAQLTAPETVYVWDTDSGEAAATRRRVIAHLPPGATVACGHYPGTGFGSIARNHANLDWREAP
jgi:glyoxylase-like metal-dependent hydrolase (beta-lactamase superfamily II)